MANILLSTGYTNADLKGCKTADGFTILAQMPNGDSITLSLNNQEADKIKTLLNLYQFGKFPVSDMSGPQNTDSKKRLR